MSTKIFLSKDQVRGVKQEIADLERMLKTEKKYIQFPQNVHAEIKKKKKLLEDHSPQEFANPAEQNKAYERWKKLSEEITDKLPTQKDYYRPAKTDKDTHSRQWDFDNSVNQQVAFMKDKDLQDKIREWKYLGKRIDPEDPSLANIEILRRRGM